MTTSHVSNIDFSSNSNKFQAFSDSNDDCAFNDEVEDFKDDELDSCTAQDGSIRCFGTRRET
eukprot:CAMPEP_0171295900 /NCGR_PEP_ID=MMETSP0816-20121228/4556_1 /TAXON_ID=420281 /ORGANISM="Proboscia inermis, Strain CCAP1064/1" /LENGTH=61 /DNA_ID=CAMNT_0011768935 /DNA_START=121 /DNA_END=306 /DNA_ORIENTATION=+